MTEIPGVDIIQKIDENIYPSAVDKAWIVKYNDSSITPQSFVYDVDMNIIDKSEFDSGVALDRSDSDLQLYEFIPTEIIPYYRSIIEPIKNIDQSYQWYYLDTHTKYNCSFCLERYDSDSNSVSTDFIDGSMHKQCLIDKCKFLSYIHRQYKSEITSVII